MRNLLKLKVYI